MKIKIVGFFIIALLIITVYPKTLSSADNKQNDLFNNIQPSPRMISFIPYGLTTEVYSFQERVSNSKLSLARGWYWKEPYPNYAPNLPSGMPDFDQKQGKWQSISDGGNGIADTTALGDDVQIVPLGSPVSPDNFYMIIAPGVNCELETLPSGDDWNGYSFCGAVSLANCLWYLDSKYSDKGGTPGDGIDEFPLVEDYDAGDDHSSDNVPNFIRKIANEVNITNRGLLNFDDCLIGINKWFSDNGLDDLLSIEIQYYPTFEFITEEIEQGNEVILCVFWYDNCLVLGGHVITIVGINSEEKLIAVSDPYFDIQNTSSDPQGHNDAKNVSHDIYHISLGTPCPNLPHNFWLPDYQFDCSLAEIAIVIKSNIKSTLSTSGKLHWDNVTPGSLVSDTFQVINEGDPYSLLEWEITEWPQNWGEWTFIPSHGDGLRPEDNSVNVEVAVLVPEESNKDFYGQIKIVNIENPDDYEIIEVTLSTPRNRLINSNLFSQLFERFPIIRQLLNLLS